MWKRYVVRKSERALLMREGDFVEVLEPGVFTRFDPRQRLSLQTMSLEVPLSDLPLADYLRRERPDTVEQYFVPMDVTEGEAGLRYENDVLVQILPPGTRLLYWKSAVRHRLERLNLTAEYALPVTLTNRLAQSEFHARPVSGLQGVALVRVPAYSAGVLKLDGKVERLLEPGLWGFWRFSRDVVVDSVELRTQSLEVSGQEILSNDKVTLRVNLAANWRFVEPLRALEQFPKPAEHLYRELQFALRAVIGARTVDDLLDNKTLIDTMVTTHLVARLVGTGIEISNVGVKDIILPGDMRALLSQVVEAEKTAQANVIRRREEAAATRSLLNAAKVMEENPTALRLKELETLERISQRIERLCVVGGLDQLLHGLVTINGARR